VAGAAFQVRAVAQRYDEPQEPHPHQVKFYSLGKMPATCFGEIYGFSNQYSKKIRSLVKEYLNDFSP